VDDLVDGIIKMMSTPDEFIGPVNMGNPTEFTITQLAEKVIKLTGSKSKIVREALPEDDPMQRKPVIDIAKKNLGWEPKIQLEEGLIKTIDYFKSILK
jgi:UDP-glucuronate decarboxylase